MVVALKGNERGRRYKEKGRENEMRRRVNPLQSEGMEEEMVVEERMRRWKMEERRKRVYVIVARKMMEEKEMKEGIEGGRSVEGGDEGRKDENRSEREE